MSARRQLSAAVITAVVLLGGSTALAAVPASASTSKVSCPTVNKDTRAVTPAPGPGVDWSGCNLTDADLYAADLAKANLSKADLTGADLDYTSLGQANLAGANLTGAFLTGARAPDASLSGATLTSVVAEALTLTGADLESANFTAANLQNSGATSADLDSADLSGANLSGVDLTNADLTDTDFGTASADGLTFTGATLTGASLADATITGTVSGGIVGQPAALPADWSITDGWLIAPDSDYLGSADLAGLNLTGADLAGARLNSANLTGTNLTNANLSGAQAPGATVTGTILTGASLSQLATSDLTGSPAALPQNWTLCGGFLAGPAADLASQNLADLDLSGTDLAGANISSSTLTNVNLSGANLADVNATDATFAGADLASTNLQGATLLGVSSGGISGTPSALPTSWSVFGGYLVGPEAMLTGADLAGINLASTDVAHVNLTDANLSAANLTDAQLPGAILTGANVAGAALTGANAADVTSGGITGTPASLPSGWLLANGYLVGPEVNLADATLNGQQLAGADLRLAQLRGADLDGADLAGADLSGADALDASLANADLSAASLADSDLASASLTGANLSNADVNDATLNLADLDGATVTGATWTSARWYDTVCPDGTNSNKYLGGCFSALDTTAPVAAPVVTSGTAGTNGWYTSELEVTWNWTDNGTINSNACTQWTDGDSNGDPVTLTATCTDLAGNVGYASLPLKIDMSRPAVTVTGVAAGGVYAAGKVPAAGCRTTETVSGVQTAATHTTTSTGSGGTGTFTTTCAGAVSMAGLAQAKPVADAYTVAYGFDAFSSPRSGATVTRSRTLTVYFRLAGSNGKALASSTASRLADRHDVRAVLSAPGIATVRDLCHWRSGARDFACTLTVPAGTRTGSSHRYTITATEDVGTGFVAVPKRDSSSSAETIHFR